MKEKINYTIHPNLSKFQSKVKTLHADFNTIGKTLRNKRNHLKTDTWGDTSICIKSFKKPTLFNQLIYGYIRGSKAKRSFLFAQQLEQLGIHTPTPIAYIECRNAWGGISHSYYICEYESYTFRLSEISSSKLSDHEMQETIHTLVEFTCKNMYDNKIHNKDFNGTNILVSKVNDAIQFSFIDINRMHFNTALSRHDELNNLAMISGDPKILCMIAQAYANVRQIDEKQVTYALFATKYFMKKKRQTTKKALRPLKEASAHFHKLSATS